MLPTCFGFRENCFENGAGGLFVVHSDIQANRLDADSNRKGQQRGQFKKISHKIATKTLIP